MTAAQYFNFRRVILLIVSIVCAFSYQSAIAVTFTDGFESGDLSKSDGDFKWSAQGVVTDFAKDGLASLKFLFKGSDPGGQAWSEKRFSMSGNHNDIWLKADIFIPGNYYCRGGDHNKGPFYVWSGTYGTWSAHVAAKFEHWCSRGSAYLTFNPAADGSDYGHYATCLDPDCAPGGVPNGTPYNRGVPFVDLTRDLNKWHEWIVHIKPATTSTSKDGVVEVWKDGRKVWYRYDLPYHSEVANYFDQGYLMGYSNSGFDVDTIIHYDNFVFSTEKITANAAPKPPSFFKAE